MSSETELAELNELHGKLPSLKKCVANLRGMKKPIKHSPYRSPDEKRMRKSIRALITRFTHLELKQDDLVRELYTLVEDERRRALMGARVSFGDESA